MTTSYGASPNHNELQQWLPVLPPGWDLRRAKYMLKEIDARTLTGSEVLLSLSKDKGVVPRSELGASDEGRADTLVGYKYVTPGQIVMNKMQAWNGMFGLSQRAGLVSPEYTVLEPQDSNDAGFLTYLLRCNLYVSQFGWRSRGMGTAFLRLHPENLLDTPLVAPPAHTQRAIADFLDRETARIDALVTTKRRMIGLSNDRLSAHVDQLTRDASVPVVALRRLLARQITDGPHESPEFVEDGIPFLSIEAVVNDHLSFENCRMISRAAHDEYARKVCPEKGDVLLAKTGATIGKVALVETDREFNIWSPLAVLRPKQNLVRPRYLWHSLRGRWLQDQIRLWATQSTQPNIAMGDIASLPIRLPSLARQDAVLSVLDLETERHERLRSAIERQAALLVEHRQALITAAVTGDQRIESVAA